MEGLRRVMLSPDGLDDEDVGCGLSALQGTPMEYDADCLQMTDSTDLCKLSHLNLQSSVDPVLHDRRLDNGYIDDDVMYTELTTSHREFHSASSGDSSAEQDMSDCSSSESSLGSPTGGVQWETVAECPVVALAMDPEAPLPPVSDIFTHKGLKDDFLGLSNRRPMSTVLVKTEIPDSGDDSMESVIPHYLPATAHSHIHHQHHHHRLHHNITISTTTATTTFTTTTTTNNNNHHDYTTFHEVDENNNETMVESSRRIAQSQSASLCGGEKAPRKKPGRKKGQVSKVLHLWEFIRDLLADPACCPRIITWENEPEGVFRVLKSSEVARLWGEKKKNKKVMTYEKLSRSLRYSRKEGYFDALPKERGYPKKLCFKFGPKSHGWRDCKC